MPETYVLITRLVLAGILGGLIGAEREYRAKVAGMRTHLLVAIGAALMLIVSRYGFDGQGDPSRVAAHGYIDVPNGATFELSRKQIVKDSFELHVLE